MKKLSYVFYLVLAVVFTSCNIEAENEYNREYWKYKTKELELDYLKKLNSVKNDAELKQTIIYLDSLEANYR